MNELIKIRETLKEELKDNKIHTYNEGNENSTGNSSAFKRMQSQKNAAELERCRGNNHQSKGKL